MTEAEAARQIDMFLGKQKAAIITRETFPWLIEFAPCCGVYERVGEFTVTRRKVDQLDQFTVSRKA